MASDQSQVPYYCHQCSTRITPKLPDYTCPNCNGGFIESLSESNNFLYEDQDDDPVIVHEQTNDGSSREGPVASRLRSHSQTEDDSPPPMFPGAGPSTSAGGGGGGNTIVFTNGPTRLVFRNFSGGPPSGFGLGGPEDGGEQDLNMFFTNLLSNIFGGENGGIFGPPGSFVFNPGDYAWGNSGLDAIITQLLNSAEGTGAPPADPDKVKELPTVKISQKEVDASMQCSVCFENFELEEPVKQLPCTHFYHDKCIMPWLELHGTCPVCRKDLDGNEPELSPRVSESEPNTETSNTASAADSPPDGPRYRRTGNRHHARQTRGRQLLAALRRGGRRSSNSNNPSRDENSESSRDNRSASGGGGGTSSNSRNTPPSDDYELD